MVTDGDTLINAVVADIISDEGYYAWSGSTDYIYDGDSGMDFDNNLLISNIDFGTFHLYRESLGQHSFNPR